MWVGIFSGARDGRIEGMVLSQHSPRGVQRVPGARGQKLVQDRLTLCEWGHQ